MRNLVNAVLNALDTIAEEDLYTPDDSKKEQCAIRSFVNEDGTLQTVKVIITEDQVAAATVYEDVNYIFSVQYNERGVTAEIDFFNSDYYEGSINLEADEEYELEKALYEMWDLVDFDN